jgi:uncharacterized protein
VNVAVRVGLIADTHGLLRPQALAALHGSHCIVHAGDIGDPAILAALAQIAPVTAVRGNNDRDGWARELPDAVTIERGGVRIHVVHDIAELAVDPAAAGIRVVVAGHSHQPSCTERAGVLFVNPGSAGPRRFRLPIGVATLTIAAMRVEPRLITLTP